MIKRELLEGINEDVLVDLDDIYVSKNNGIGEYWVNLCLHLASKGIGA